LHHLSAFDLDHTLFTDNSSYRFGVYLYRQNIIPLSSLIFIIGCNFRYRLGFLSITALHKKGFHRLFYGRPVTLVREWAKTFVEKHFDRLVYPPALAKLRHAQKAGHMTAILSSSPDFLIEQIAYRFGVDKWFATQYGIDKDHKFCMISQLMQGEDKARDLANLASELHLSKKDITAYSDSYLDLPFLLAAGNPVGVNPDRKLRAICLQNNWPVI
jgi:HAD superfamily hydrolase (TIGR01490 family)